MTRNWKNWSGYHTSQPQSWQLPADLMQLSSIIQQSPAPIRIKGTGHSFTPLVKSDGTILSLDAFTGVVSHDNEALTVTAGAGIKIGDLATLMHTVGQAFPNMGDIDTQAFAGAIGTGTHGSGITLGAYHTQLEALQLVDGRGEVRDFSKARSADDLLAVVPSLGAFGAVTQFTIRNVPNYRLRRQRRAVPIGDIIDQFHNMMTAHRSAEFFYVPFSGMAFFITSDMSEQSAETRPQDEDMDAVEIMAKMQKYFGRMPLLRRAILKRLAARIPEEDYVGDWLTVYPSARDLRFNEMEYHLPVEEGPTAIAEIIAIVERRFHNVYFPIEVRLVAGDNALLSPFYKRPSVSIAIHHQAGADPMPYFNAIEPIFRRYGGRPHWGKMHSLRAADLRAVYPRFDEAMVVRRDIDPENRFVSPYIASLFGIEK